MRGPALLNRLLDEAGYTNIDLKATYLHGRQGKAMQLCSRAVAKAMGADFVGTLGVDADGHRELLGLKVGNSENVSL